MIHTQLAQGVVLVTETVPRKRQEDDDAYVLIPHAQAPDAVNSELLRHQLAFFGLDLIPGTECPPEIHSPETLKIWCYDLCTDTYVEQEKEAAWH